MSNKDAGSPAPEVQSEIEHGHAGYTDAELLEQCQLNAQALMLAVFSTLERDPATLGSVVDGIAATFARAWDTERKWEPNEVLDGLLTNYRSMGATVERYEPDVDAPNATLSGLPDAVLAQDLQVPSTGFRPMLAVSERLAGHLGCELEWSHDAPAGVIRLQVGRKS